MSHNCIADTSLLNNFVHSGSAYLLNRLLEGPVRLSPAVLDVQETLLPEFPRVSPTSEFLKPLYMSSLPEYADHRRIAPFIQSFALSAGDSWEPVDLEVQELLLASRLSSKSIRARVKSACPQITRPRIELDPGEAEAAAIAIIREWTLLTEDQASADLLRCLYPSVPIVRTCPLLAHAVKQDHISCPEAADLFNRRMVDDLGFWAFRRFGGQRERLWFRCDPPRGTWERESSR